MEHIKLKTIDSKIVTRIETLQNKDVSYPTRGLFVGVAIQIPFFIKMLPQVPGPFPGSLEKHDSRQVVVRISSGIPHL